MRVYDSGGWFGGRPRFTLDIKPELFILIAFFVTTAYLQMFAIRFNSLVAVPAGGLQRLHPILIGAHHRDSS